ncbi:hypothetical protein [Casimicrobium huifangae]|jgi:hypothetical protein|uniref:hypothetical protein n=1 Tax=Casimicrobium huifangae TaxID=2591109 RepID=UPI002C0478CB|nr:hypothetical protein [Casimicrobium huifangae]
MLGSYLGCNRRITRARLIAGLCATAGQRRGDANAIAQQNRPTGQFFVFVVSFFMKRPFCWAWRHESHEVNIRPNRVLSPD